MRRQIERTLLILLGIGAAVIPIRSQTKPQKPSFEVVSVKPSPPNLNIMMRLGGGQRGDRLTLSSVSLRVLVSVAYRDSNGEPLGSPEIFGGPDWMESALFDIEAKTDCSGGIISNDQLALMMQSMLEDRFQLKAHVETRDMPVYNLVVGKDGPKLKASTDQTPLAPLVPMGQLCGSVRETLPAPLPSFPGPGIDMSQLMSQMPRGAMLVLSGAMEPAGAIAIHGRATSVSRLVNTLKFVTGRPLIDKTGLTGLFDMSLRFRTDGLALPGRPAGVTLSGLPAGSPSGPLEGTGTLFSEIQDLGLMLEQARGPVQVLVIDSVQKPSEN